MVDIRELPQSINQLCGLRVAMAGMDFGASRNFLSAGEEFYEIF
jgi:hypothetical protein